MTDSHIVHQLSALFHSHFGVPPASVKPLPVSGSVRRYFRLTAPEDTGTSGRQTTGRSGTVGGDNTVIGAWNKDLRENDAFFYLTRLFEQQGFPVPHLIVAREEKGLYLQTDLGQETLFDRLDRNHPSVALPGESSGEVTTLYHSVLRWLVQFQINAAPHIDFNRCFPRSDFDRQSMLWDLNYFKYYYLRPAGIPYHEQELENDFNQLADFLLQAPSGYFLYRDFQSRNIMIKEDTPWFIDYQGGRRGALPYDVASLLYDAKADLPQAMRDILLDYYLHELEHRLPGSHDRFIRYYPGFILIRILQAMGAYGYRGYFERKPHFLQSVPYAIVNLQRLLNDWTVTTGGEAMPALRKALEIVVSAGPRHGGKEKAQPSSTPQVVKVAILSFSYRSGLPPDPHGHGGGFVFDCRALPNPGRYDDYRSLTGKDPEVIAFLEREAAVVRFLDHVFALVDQSITTYAERGFAHLQVAFGCTGGQHRSVYCAEKLAGHLAAQRSCTKELRHMQFPDI